MTRILNLIQAIRESDPYQKVIFTNGGCYRFHLILKSLCPGAIPLMNKEKSHVVTLCDGYIFDINGLVEGRFYPMSESDIKLAESWSFEKTRMLKLGECEHCGEPIKL